MLEGNAGGTGVGLGAAVRNQQGVTLLEAVLVLGLLAILLMLALPLYQGFIRERWVDRVAQDVAGLLRSAQQSAVGDAVDGCYRVQVNATNAVEERGVRDPATRACTWTIPSAIRATDTFPAGVTVTLATVEFTGAGALAGGSPFAISISSGGRTRTVNVAAQTGRVQIAP